MNGHGCTAGGKAVRRQAVKWRRHMKKDDQKKSYKKFVLLVGGFFILVLGITLILACWKDVVSLFRGASGMVLALGGLFMLYAVSKIDK